MDLAWAIGAVVAAVALATALGLLWRARAGRVRSDGRELAEVASAHGDLGARATLLQFSTEFCSPCRATARLLGDLAGRRDGLAYVEVDLTDRPDLAQRLNILQTPTTFVLDARGRSRARIGGAPRLPELLATLDALTPEAAHVRA
jgi:thiol-disulfide isomerase/thioredoxin